MSFKVLECRFVYVVDFWVICLLEVIVVVDMLDILYRRGKGLDYLGCGGFCMILVLILNFSIIFCWSRILFIMFLGCRVKKRVCVVIVFFLCICIGCISLSLCGDLGLFRDDLVR